MLREGRIEISSTAMEASLSHADRNDANIYVYFRD